MKVRGRGFETSSLLLKTLVVSLENSWNSTKIYHIEEEEILATVRWLQFWHPNNELLDLWRTRPLDLRIALEIWSKHVQYFFLTVNVVRAFVKRFYKILWEISFTFLSNIVRFLTTNCKAKELWLFLLNRNTCSAGNITGIEICELWHKRRWPLNCLHSKNKRRSIPNVEFCHPYANKMT